MRIDGDARGEAGDHRKGNELDGGAQLGQAERDQQQARHDRGDGQSIHAVLLDDPIDDHDEGAGRAADLHPRAAQRRDDEPGDNGGIEPPVGRDPARDGKGDGQRQRHDAHDQAGGQIGPELGRASRSGAW